MEKVMLIRNVAMTLALSVAGVGAVYAPAASAGVAVGVSVGLPAYGPPAPIVEHYGVARPGYVWVPGYWNWTGYRYAWTGGYWGPVRVGYHYAPARWVGCGPRWCYHGGRWVR